MEVVKDDGKGKELQWKAAKIGRKWESRVLDFVPWIEAGGSAGDEPRSISYSLSKI